LVFPGKAWASKTFVDEEPLSPLPLKVLDLSKTYEKESHNITDLSLLSIAVRLWFVCFIFLPSLVLLLIRFFSFPPPFSASIRAQT
jgi:hypothetical protein